MLDWLFRRSAGPAGRAERWVVLDVETTGLDPDRDTLLAIAALALQRDGDRLTIRLADSFTAVLQRDAEGCDKANILLHGIGLGRQRAGADAAQVLRAFGDWCGDAPRLGYHVAFDRRMIELAEAATLGRARRVDWVCIEQLARASEPAVGRQALDAWLERYRIPCLRRHDAAADTLATAELLLRLWPRLRREGVRDAASLRRLAERARWLPG